MPDTIANVKKNLRRCFWSATLIPPVTRLCDLSKSNSNLGARGELAAERFLLKQGLIIVARGYQDKLGEIDLIAVDGRTLVFVEVKTRKSDFAGHPAEAVDQEKQRRLTRVALGYLKWHRLENVAARFDVIAITWPDLNRKPTIEHFVNAFEPATDWNMHA